MLGCLSNVCASSYTGFGLFRCVPSGDDLQERPPKAPPLLSLWRGVTERETKPSGHPAVHVSYTW